MSALSPSSTSVVRPSAARLSLRVTAAVAASCLSIVALSAPALATPNHKNTNAVAATSADLDKALAGLSAKQRAEAKKLIRSAEKAARNSAEVPSTPAVEAISPMGFFWGGSTTGNGVWAPSHDEATAIIPICGGPVALLGWLKVNFGDHGRDLSNFVSMNYALLTSIMNGSTAPWALLQLILMPFLQIPVYAINDTKFHIPATLADILGFCKSQSSTPSTSR